MAVFLSSLPTLSLAADSSRSPPRTKPVSVSKQSVSFQTPPPATPRSAYSAGYNQNAPSIFASPPARRAPPSRTQPTPAAPATNSQSAPASHPHLPGYGRSHSAAPSTTTLAASSSSELSKPPSHHRK